MFWLHTSNGSLDAIALGVAAWIADADTLAFTGGARHERCSVASAPLCGPSGALLHLQGFCWVHGISGGPSNIGLEPAAAWA